MPNRAWGGEGLLGCGVGYGLLHRIPKPQDRVVSSSAAAVEGTRNELDRDEGSLSQQGQGQSTRYSEVQELNPRTVNRTGERKDSSGYEQVTYENFGGADEFGASEGVQVIPLTSEHDHHHHHDLDHDLDLDLDFYSPKSTSRGASGYSNKSTLSTSVSSGGGGGGGGGGRTSFASIPPYRAPPISPSAYGRGGVGLITEEDE